MGDKHGKTGLYKVYSVFRNRLMEKWIPLVRIRYSGNEGENFLRSGDHDFIVPPDSRDELLETLFSVCCEHGCSFLLNRKKDIKSKAVLYDNRSHVSTVLEFWTSLEVGNDPSSCRYIEWDRIKPLIRQRENIRFLDISFEALYYLSHLLTKGKETDSDSVKRRVAYYCKHDGIDEEVRALYKELKKGIGISVVGRKANKLLRSRGLLEGDRRINSGIRKLRLVLYKFGGIILNRERVNRIIAVLGPDGVGKTAVIDGIVKKHGGKISTYRFKNYYRTSLLYRVLYPVYKWYVQRRDSRTYKRNQIEEMVSYQLYILSLIRYRINPGRMFSRKILIVDRYFHDYILTGSRLNEDGISRHRKWRELVGMIPKTLAFLQMDADNETIHARRSEISSAHIDAFRGEYFDLSMRCFSNYYVYLNNGSSLSDTLETLTRMIKRMKILVSER